MCKSARGQVIWRKIQKSSTGYLATYVLRTLLDRYNKFPCVQIPTYEVEEILKELDIPPGNNWKNLINLLCFDAKIFDLKFILFVDDNCIDISFDELQLILSGEPIKIGAIVYSSKVAESNIFTYLIPTKRFEWLRNSTGAYSA